MKHCMPKNNYDRALNVIFEKLIYSHLFFRRFAAHCRSCKIAIFTRRIPFSTGLFACICLRFIFTCTVDLIDPSSNMTAWFKLYGAGIQSSGISKFWKDWISSILGFKSCQCMTFWDTRKDNSYLNSSDTSFLFAWNGIFRTRIFVVRCILLPSAFFRFVTAGLKS